MPYMYRLEGNVHLKARGLNPMLSAYSQLAKWVEMVSFLFVLFDQLSD